MKTVIIKQIDAIVYLVRIIVSAWERESVSKALSANMRAIACAVSMTIRRLNPRYKPAQ